MNNQATIDKMNQLKLHGMALSFKNMLESGSIHEFAPDEALAHLIESEYDERYNRRIKMLIKAANFRKVVHLEEIIYDSCRNIVKKQLLKFHDSQWLEKGEFRVHYSSSNQFFGNLKYERSCGNYFKRIEQLAKKDLLILDDFGLEILDKDSRIILFDVLESRIERKSILVASQIPIDAWYELIGDKTLADAICDRIIPNSIKIELKGDSMRKKRKSDT
jgi:DNA replication protein DnaC